ncbi:MAG: hypothetical protein V8S84_08260 [Lachnospiraceae bacterium]
MKTNNDKKDNLLFFFFLKKGGLLGLFYFLIPLAAILITNLVHTVRLAKTIAKEEEEAAVKEAIQALRVSRLIDFKERE